MENIKVELINTNKEIETAKEEMKITGRSVRKKS